MRITVVHLFFALAILLNYTELSSGMPPKRNYSKKNAGKSISNSNPQGMSSSSSLGRVKYVYDVGTSGGHANNEESNSTLRTVEELFRGCNGVLPRMESLLGSRTVRFRNFRQLGKRKMVDPVPSLFAVRDYVIFGWMINDYVQPLGTLFDTTDEFVVFDMIKDRWYTMARDEFLKLGTGRHYKLVVERDEVAHSVRPESNRPIDLQAHLAGCEHANREADSIEALQEATIPRAPLTQRTEAMARGYANKYREARDNYKKIHGTNQTSIE